MATGYTYPVKDGTVTDFREFALSCARAFGALIHMRDDDNKAEIRPREVSTYYREAIVRDQAALAHLEMLTPEQIDAEAQQLFVAQCDAAARYNEDNIAELRRYAEMIRQVEAWHPPTADHEGLKTFMLSQLEESRLFDSHSPSQVVQYSGEHWFAKEHQRLRESIAYHEEKQAEEQKRVDEANRWIEQLRESLEAQVSA